VHTRRDFDPRAGACGLPRVDPEGVVRLTQALAWASAVGTAVDRQGWRLKHLGSSIDTIAAALRVRVRFDASPTAVAPEACGEHRLPRILAEVERLVARLHIPPAIVAAGVSIRLP